MMPTKEIRIHKKPCDLMKPYKNPEYGSKTILTDSCWEYVLLYLSYKSSSSASDVLFYWNQAQSFYMASKSLPDSASPLTSYYCILNASKALLRYKGVENGRLGQHGISSSRKENDKVNLDCEHTNIKGAGVLPELARYYGFNMASGDYCISNLLYNIPCIHRAYCITTKKPELFIPIINPVFVKKEKSAESWIRFEVCENYNIKFCLPPESEFEIDKGVKDRLVVRKKNRFKWDIHTPIKDRKCKINNYHEKARKHLYYIYAESKLWYFKKSDKKNECLQLAPDTVLIFGIFHWLSELVRYNPKLFDKYMKSKYNWLFHEFITNALDQFIDEISCEITGKDIMCTGYRK